MQGTFDELGSPLREATFVVVDLETTGGSPAAGARITEIGAVKVRAGEVLGEFQTLVDPGCAVPSFIAVLTGITDAMVRGAPSCTAAVSSFLAWCGPCVVLVAHNAPFDTGFLRAACAEASLDWPPFAVVDTARLARQLVTRDEAPDCKLSSLARLFRAATTPNHRALDDARATVDVLHGLLERVGALGVHSVEELATYSSRVPAQRRRKRHLADRLPSAPGVYVFRDSRGRALYVGTSRDLRARVRSYFTAAETRRRMTEMIGLAESVDAIVCATTLEAQVRELRMIAELKPRYNRRSKTPERALWLKLTVEAFPRLSLVRQVRDDGADYLGPFTSARTAERALAALHEAVPIRQCSARLSPRKLTTPCALAEMGRCGAPCAGGETVQEYASHVEVVRHAFVGDPRRVTQVLGTRISTLAATERFEDAAAARDRLAAFVGVSARLQRLRSLTGCRLLVAARPDDQGGWQLAAVRWGRLVGAATVGRGVAPGPHIDALVATAEVVVPGPGPLPAAGAEEVECVLRWLEQPGTRLIEVDGTWASPCHGAGAERNRLDGAFEATPAAPFRDRRSLRPSA